MQSFQKEINNVIDIYNTYNPDFFSSYMNNFLILFLDLHNALYRYALQKYVTTDIN